MNIYLKVVLEVLGAFGFYLITGDGSESIALLTIMLFLTFQHPFEKKSKN